MKSILICFFVFWSSLALAANVRPSNETAYTIQTSDANDYVIGTNGAAQMVWTLDAMGSYASDFSFTAINTAAYPVTITPVDVGIGVNAGFPSYSLVLNPNQSARIFKGGANWLYTLGISGQSNGIGSVVNSFGYSAQTWETYIQISGSCTTGNTPGFDITWSGLSSPVQIRTTVNCSAGGIEAAAFDLAAQFRNNATIQAGFTKDIALQAHAMPAGPSAWQMYFNGYYPIAASIVVTPVSSGTATITASPIQTGLGNRSGFACGASSWHFGRAGQAGDGLCGFFVLGDTATSRMNGFTDLPWYSATLWSIVDPNAITLSSKADTLMGPNGIRNFFAKTVSVSGQFIVGAQSTNLDGQIVAHLGTNGNAGMLGGNSMGAGGTIYGAYDNAQPGPLEIVSTLLKLRFPASGSGGEPLCIDTSNHVYKGSGGHC